MATVTSDKMSARERLLAAANELFYAEGVHSVGIDRVIEHAGVAKASLYNTFGSKDELVRAYLGEKHRARQERIEARIDAVESPRDKVLAVFDALGDRIADPTFRGCAFVNASAESRPGDVVRQVSDDNRAWIRTLFEDLVRAAGAPDPEHLARGLVLLYDGATVGAGMDHDSRTAATARAMAVIVLDAALARV